VFTERYGLNLRIHRYVSSLKGEILFLVEKIALINTRFSLDFSLALL